MALFILNSEITIGSYRFSGVHRVRIRRGLHGYIDTATIELPSRGSVQKGTLQDDGSVKLGPISVKDVTTGSLFKDGDAVTIKLGYNGDLREEFRGFIVRRDLAKPLKIECEGYSYQLRLKNSQKGYYKNTTAKDMLLLACENTDISVLCPVDFPLVGLRIPNIPANKILDYIISCSSKALTIFFIEPTVLWCGLVYTPYLAGSSVFNLPTVNYRLGYNVVKDNGLKERFPSQPVQVIMNGKVVTGQQVMNESKDKAAAQKAVHLMNNVGDSPTLQSFAQELQLNMNYTGYEGWINGFLQPFALPGYNANIVDMQYPERNGVYMIESTEVEFGVSGARRRVMIGPKLNGGN